MTEYIEHYTTYVGVSAEGKRIALASCKRCGCAITWSASDSIDLLGLHSTWHTEILDRLSKAESVVARVDEVFQKAEVREVEGTSSLIYDLYDALQPEREKND